MPWMVGISNYPPGLIPVMSPGLFILSIMKAIRLADRVELKGPGIPGLEAMLVKREGSLCMYERSDGYFEVFIVEVQREGSIKGRVYPTREVYPGNEDFGNTAWCFLHSKDAEVKFANLLRFGKDK